MNIINDEILENKEKILDRADDIINDDNSIGSDFRKDLSLLLDKYSELQDKVSSLLKDKNKYQKKLKEFEQKLEEERQQKADLEDKLTKKIEELKEKKNELEETNKELKEISTRDQLTGLYNRREFENVIQREWRDAIREGYSISIIMMDIDKFKNFNDNYGHLAGDNCLQQVSKTMERTLKRPRDFLARYGGEEFIAVLPKTDREGAEHIAEELRKRIYKQKIPHETSPVADYVTISLGVAATSEPEFFVFEEILDKADEALYEAKETGRNKYCVAQLL